MKKYIFAMAAFILGIAQMNAQNFVFDEVVEVPQGGKAPMAIKYVTGGKTITTYSFNFVLPEGLSLTQGKTGMDWVMDEKNEGFTTMPQGTTGMACLSPNVASIYLDGTEGTLGTVSLEADASLEIGQELTVTVNTLQLVEYTSEGTYVTTNVDPITFKVKIVENCVTLDETSTTAPEAAENVNVLVKRSVKAGNWGTMCLPFDMTPEQMIEAFGEGVALADFNDYEIVEEGEGKNAEIVGITVKFSTVTTGIVKNHPYILKATKSITYDEGFKVENVTIEPADQEDLEINFGTSRRPHSIVGTYIPQTIDELCLFLSGNKFYYSTGKTQIKGYRAWFNFDDILTEVDDVYGAKIGILVDGESTAIDGMGYQRNTEGVYDLSGRKIQLKDGDLNKLQKGVYIIDGKKVTIK